jgi:hypothetical protein
MNNPADIVRSIVREATRQSTQPTTERGRTRGQLTPITDGHASDEPRYWIWGVDKWGDTVHPWNAQ